MKKKITYKDQEFIVDIQQTDQEITISWDDRTYHFSKSAISKGLLLTHENQSIVSSVVQKNQDTYSIQVNGKIIELVHKDPYALTSQDSLSGGHGNVKAVMPGRVVKILVNEGQTVDQNQPVLVLEAMKMENEIKAPIAGKIESIFVKQGQSVESGAKLIGITNT
ncbi:MAG: acetyl-CoA carboxylase biotin carboxyl carrier protein subunit [Bdellovibrionales bacterium]|nr:acetyl-CoA carboxylase biotin carboxyl carrier protein subunit [Bdellovibrionales bacterium]